MTTRVATLNVQKDLSEAVAGTAMDTVLGQADLAALQEFKADRNPLLEDMPGWDLRRARGGGPPVGVRRSWGEILTVRRLVLAKAQHVDKVAGRKSVLPDNVATLATCRQYGQKRKTAFYSIHLPSHVQFWPGPRRDMHDAAVLRLQRSIRWQLGLGRRVFVAGDTNWDEFVLDPLVSCWHGRHAAGTLGGRTVDIVYAETPAKAVHTYGVGSDHRAVVAVYS